MNKQLTDEMFQNALFNEDELGSVIRVHLHIEYHVNEILELLMPHAENIKSLKLDYEGKVNLICALGVKPENKDILLTLGTIRNKFAHNPFYKMDKSEINNLYKSLTAKNKDLLQKAHEKTRKQTSDNTVKPYNELNPRDKFIIISVIIRNVVISITNEIKTKNV